MKKSCSVWHYFFPVLAPPCSRYSPDVADLEVVPEDALAAHVEVALAAAVQARGLAGLQVEQGAAPGEEIENQRGAKKLKMCEKLENIAKVAL